jgi:uncharacterized phiE125 gp8 family phage protein
MQVDITGAAVDQDTIITVSDLKAHMRVTHTQEDTLIGALRSAAIAWVEEHCNIKLGSYTARGYLPGFYNSYIPIGPVTAISEVKYQTTEDTDYAADLTTLAATYWFTDLISQPARIAFRDYPHVYDYALTPVVVTYARGGFVYGRVYHYARARAPGYPLACGSHVREPARGGYRHNHDPIEVRP